VKCLIRMGSRLRNPAPKEKLVRRPKMVPLSLVGPKLEIIWPLSEFYHNRSPNSVRLWCASHKYESKISSTAVTELQSLPIVVSGDWNRRPNFQFLLLGKPGISRRTCNVHFSAGTNYSPGLDTLRQTDYTHQTAHGHFYLPAHIQRLDN